MKNFTLKKTAPYQYIEIQESAQQSTAILQNNTVEHLQAALENGGITNAKVISAQIMSGKDLKDKHPLFENLPAFPFNYDVLDQIGDFCDVHVQETTAGGHLVDIYVWAPLKWNERFLGCGGGGLQTVNDIRLFESLRSNTMVGSLLNGFATACTDGGLKDERVMSWGLDLETNELDLEMIQNWSHRSLHSMTVIGKLITTAIYGKQPVYSYYQGASTGGRMGLVEAQAYPEDYDGIWVDAPATNFARFQMSGSWPLYVMNWHNNQLSEAKLNTFRDAVLAEFANDEGYIDSIAPLNFDPHSIVGQMTEDGPITTSDADVMAEIYQGPHTESGKKLFYGLRPETDTWNQNGLGLISYLETEEGTKEPFEFIIPETYVSNWVIEDANWSYKNMTRKQYEQLFRYSQEKFKDIIKGEDADFSAFKAKGGKLLMSHCAGDALVFADGTVELYHRMCQKLGGENQTADFLRFYLTPAGSHCFHTELGLTLADGMIALMNWVENGVAPEVLPLEKYNLTPTATGGADFNLVLSSQAKPYRISEQPAFESAVPSIFDEEPVLSRVDGVTLVKELKEAAQNHPNVSSKKRLSSNPLFG